MQHMIGSKVKISHLATSLLLSERRNGRENAIYTVINVFDDGMGGTRLGLSSGKENERIFVGIDSGYFIPFSSS